MQRRGLLPLSRRFPLVTWGMLILLGWCSAQSLAAEGYRLLADGIAVDRPIHWQQWTYPRHAMEIDPVTQELRPRYLRQPIDAVEDLDQFRIKIGDQKTYERLLRTFQRENRSLPLNIGTAPARVAGQPIVHLEDDPKAGVRKGDPVIWYYYHGGIRQAPNNPATASHILDGNLDTYWGPTTEIGEEAYNALPQAEKGPVYCFVQTATGQEERVERVVYDQAPETRRRIQYHSRSLEDWFVEVDLGRVVPVSRIVLQFVEEGMGEPFRQFRVLSTPSNDPDATWSLIGRTTQPNEDRRVVSFDLNPDGEESYEQIQRLRIVVTDSKLDKFRKVSEETYRTLPEEMRGGIDYYVLTALGGEIQRDEETYHRVGSERQGRRVYYQRERPRLADLKVWCQGDNVGLGFIDGGGSAEMVGPYTPLEQGFDGVYDTSYLQPIHFSSNEVPSNSDYWSNPDNYNRGLLTLDLGAVFWLDQLRTLGCCMGGELIVRISDRARSPNGELKWTEIPGALEEMDYKTGMDIWEGRIIVGDFEKALSPPTRARFVQTDPIYTYLGPSVRGGYQVSEYQLFGAGFPAEIILTSPLIELPDLVMLRDIRWEAEIPEPHLTGVEIRTRTGDRLLEQTQCYTSSGEEVQDAVYQKLPNTLRGPVVTQKIPGSGWSPWSPPYRHSGEPVLSPSPRKYLQIQVKLHSDSPELAPTIRSLQVGFLPPVAHQVRAEIWPDQVPLGISQIFTLYLNPTFVAARPDGPPSSRFDELRLDTSPMSDIELLDVSLGSEADFGQDTPQTFRVIDGQTDPVSGVRSSEFTDDTGRRFQALIDPETGDTLKVWEGAVAGLKGADGGSVLQLQFPRKIALLPQGTVERVYNRVILDERDQVPVDEDGRWLNEILYLKLPAEQQGRILYFALTGRTADGTAIRDSVSQGEYWRLPDSLRGEIRYFRFPLGQDRADPAWTGHLAETIRIVATDTKGGRSRRITEAEWMALTPEERGDVVYFARDQEGGEEPVDGSTYADLPWERQGHREFYVRERPRLADIEVWGWGDNLSLGMLDGGGSVALSGNQDYYVPSRGFDGDIETNFGHCSYRLRPDLGVLTVDLGATFWFHAMRISIDESIWGFIWGYIVRASEGERDFSGRMHWRHLSPPDRRDISQHQYWHVQDTYDPPQKVRWLEIALQSEDPRESRCSSITEYELFASGYPAEVVLTSPLIELPAARHFGRIAWEASTSPGTRLDIRTRSGDVRDKVVRYFDKYGAEITPESWGYLLGSMRGPTDTTWVPGSGWSSWSPPYRSSGERVISPGLRQFAQIQVKMGTEDRHVAAGLRAIDIELLTPVTGPILAEVWPSRVSAPGRTDTFEVFVRPHFIDQPAVSRSRGFNELRLVLPAVGYMELLELGMETGTADGEQLFRASSTPGVFTDAAGDALQLVDTGADSLWVRLPVPLSAFPEAPRTYNRIWVEGEQVPATRDGLELTEAAYGALDEEEQGDIRYFRRTAGGQGDVRSIEVDRVTYDGLGESERGPVRYFRLLREDGAQFPFDPAGDSLDAAAYSRLPPGIRGIVVCPGPLVRLRFAAPVFVNGATLEIAVRNSGGGADAEAPWQSVEPGDATLQVKSNTLTLQVPFAGPALGDFSIAPNPFTPNGDGVNDATRIRLSVFEITEPRLLQVRIYALDGRFVWGVSRMVDAGSQVVPWTGIDRYGLPVPPGLYLCKVSLEIDERRETVTRVRALAVVY